MNYYYLDENNRPTGPLPLADIRAKAASGAIPRDPMVAPEGADQWQRLGAVGAGGGFHVDRFLPDLVAGLLQGIRNTLSGGFLKTSIDAARDVGHYGVLAAAALAVICAVVAVFKVGSAAPLGAGLVLLVAVVIAQYIANRFFAANETLVTSSNARVSSLALLDCVALLALLGAVAALVGATIICIRFGEWRPLIPAAVTAALWTYFAVVTLHPESVNVSKGETIGGEEAIGLLTFFLRAAVKILPIYFFVLTAAGVLIAALSLFNAAGPVGAVAQMSPIPVPFRLLAGSGEDFAGITLVVSACLLPLFGYVGYILFSLPLDLWRALLSVPGKLDALKR